MSAVKCFDCGQPFDSGGTHSHRCASKPTAPAPQANAYDDNGRPITMGISNGAPQAKCETCGSPVRVVGETTLHYEPVQASEVREFPILRSRKAKAHPTKIPWWLADLAYSVYSARYGKSQTLENLAERGGFGPEEMDEFVPDWREQCSAYDALATELEAVKLAYEEQYSLLANLLNDPVGKWMARAEAAEARVAEQYQWRINLSHELDHAKAEVKRLREALEKCREHGANYDSGAIIEAIARAALEGKDYEAR